MTYRRLFVTLPMVSLVLTGLTGKFAEEPANDDGSGWIGVLIVLILLIPLVWWLKQSSKAKTTDHSHHTPTPHEPIQTSYPRSETAIAPTPVEPDFATAAAQSQPATRRTQAPAKPDDLVIIEGIGPKIAGLLYENGIQTFADLAATDSNQLVEILQKAGLSNIANPATWPEQAQLAADGQWDDLKILQGQLKGGRCA